MRRKDVVTLTNPPPPLRYLQALHYLRGGDAEPRNRGQLPWAALGNSGTGFHFSSGFQLLKTCCQGLALPPANRTQDLEATGLTDTSALQSCSYLPFWYLKQPVGDRG